MTSRKSQRKRRQDERLLPEQLVVNKVLDLDRPNSVIGIEHEFQGAWNQLCFFVRLADTVSETDVGELEQAFEECIVEALATKEPAIDWSVGFWQGDQLIRILESG